MKIRIGSKVLSRRIVAAKSRALSATRPTAGITSATLSGKTLRVLFFVRAVPGRLGIKFSVSDAHGHSTKQSALSLKVIVRPTVTIVATRAAAAEPSTAGTFTVKRTGSTAAPLAVSYTMAGTATSDTDYTGLAGSVTIPARASSVAIAVNPVDDDTVEQAESVIVTVTAKSAYVVGTASRATVTIADNDVLTAATVTIVATEPTAGEDFGSGAFTVTRTGSTTSSLTVSFTASGTATAGSDYSSLFGSVVILAGDTSATITVSPLDDTIFEPSETVIVTLSSSSSYTVGTPSNATVTIADDDAAAVSLDETDFDASEPSNTGTITVTRTGITTAALAVTYTVGGTATSGTDYTALTGTVSIPVGAASTTITVTPIDDTTLESDETVVVSLAAGSGYTVDFPSSATVTIEDNDAPSVTIAATDDSAGEPSSTGTFTVTRTGSTTASLAVTYTTSGTATSGSDYTALSGAVTIAAGESTATITVTPLDDTTVDPAETVIATLAAGTGYTVGTPGSATVTIADDDGQTVTIAATDPTAGEPSDSGTFTVTRTGSTVSALTVFYTPSGTAINGTDYTALSGIVTIPSSATTATITISVIDDMVVDPAETVTLTLSDGAYSIGMPSSDTVTIADND